MPGSPTTPGRAGARGGAPVRVAFRENDHVGTQNYLAFAAQWLACVLPYRRFADTSRMPTHGSGPVRVANPSP